MRIPELAYKAATERYKRTGERTPNLEPVIAKDPERAYLYARFFIKKRWPEAEPYIQQDSDLWREYKKHFKIES